MYVFYLPFHLLSLHRRLLKVEIQTLRTLHAGLVLKVQAAFEPNGSVDAGDVPGGLGVALDQLHVLVTSFVRFERSSLLLGQAQDFGAQPIAVADGHEGLLLKRKSCVSMFTRTKFKEVSLILKEG